MIMTHWLSMVQPSNECFWRLACDGSIGVSVTLTSGFNVQHWVSSFLLVFHLTITVKCTVLELGAWNRQTKRRTDGRTIAALLHALYGGREGIKAICMGLRINVERAFYYARWRSMKMSVGFEARTWRWGNTRMRMRWIRGHVITSICSRPSRQHVSVDLQASSVVSRYIMSLLEHRIFNHRASSVGHWVSTVVDRA